MTGYHLFPAGNLPSRSSSPGRELSVNSLSTHFLIRQKRLEGRDCVDVGSVLHITDSMDMSLGRLGVGDGQGGLECCSSQGRKESDTNERLN